jgi:protease IV
MAGQALGLPGYGGEFIREIGADRLFLDGLVSVWHP